MTVWSVSSDSSASMVQMPSPTLLRQPSAGTAGALRLTANSGLQFLDIEIADGSLGRVHAKFVEVEDDVRGVVLIPLEHAQGDDSGEWHPTTNRPLSPQETLWVTGYDALEPFAGQWLPLPLLRETAAGRSPAAVIGFDSGPTNWVRIFIDRPDAGLRETSRIKAVVAFDTKVVGGSRLDQDSYLQPNGDDVEFAAQFRLASRPGDLASFLAEPWLDDWLSACLARHRDGRHGDSDAAPGRFQLEHVARYITLLGLLERAALLPPVRLASGRPRIAPAEARSADLMIDIGDDCTSAMLVDCDEIRLGADLRGLTPLRIRDLSRPTQVTEGSFQTVGEFQRSTFGDDTASRRSGRPDAFHWPSLLRIGDEASRLRRHDGSVPGITGLTGLRSALTETHRTETVWRFTRADGGGEPGRMLAGEILAHLTEDGEVIGSNGRGGEPALRPRFSRSSLVTMFVAEILLHALSQLNAEISEDTAGGQRRLRQIAIIAPAATSGPERRLLQERLDDAIDLVWQAQGWHNDPAAPAKPQGVLGLDPSLSTQLMYLFNEVQERFSGSFARFAEMAGLPQADGGGARELTIASLHLRPGSTTLSVVGYGAERDGAVRPELLLADHGSSVASDLTDAVALAVVLPAVMAAIRASTDDGGQRLTSQVTTALQGARPVDPRTPENQLIDRVLRPAAAALLDIHAGLVPGVASEGLRHFTLASLVEAGGGRITPALPSLPISAGATAATSFDLGAVAIPLHARGLTRLIEAQLAPLTDHLADVLRAWRCDLLLLSGGHPALRGLQKLLVRTLPLAPHRIIDQPLAPWPAAGTFSPLRQQWLPLVGASLAAHNALTGPNVTLLADRLEAPRQLSVGEGLAALNDRKGPRLEQPAALGIGAAE